MDWNRETYQKLVDDMAQIAKTVGSYLMDEQQKLKDIEIIEKSANQLVSIVDVTAEKQIVAYLKQQWPNAAFITEEDTVEKKESDLQFIIDPLDGTTNFLHGLDLYSISIAAVVKEKIVAGVVYVPLRNQLFTATLGGGAFLNNQPIQVSNTKKIADSLLATGFPFYNFKQKEAYIQVLDQLMQGSRGLRRMGSAAIDLAYTAAGNFCGFFELHLHPWDVAAGILIVREAGGTVSKFNGNEDCLDGSSILATNAAIYQEFSTLVNKYFSGDC